MTDAYFDSETYTKIDFSKTNIIKGEYDNCTFINCNFENIHLIGTTCLTESSGGINEKTIRKYAECGVDFISSGALTHAVQNLDLSLKAI